MFWSATDWLADYDDVQWLLEQLPSHQIVWNRDYDRYSHLGFTWSAHAYKDLYPDVVYLIDKHTSADRRLPHNLL